MSEVIIMKEEASKLLNVGGHQVRNILEGHQQFGDQGVILKKTRKPSN